MELKKVIDWLRTCEVVDVTKVFEEFSKDAMDFVIKSLNDGAPITLEFIKNLHSRLCGNVGENVVQRYVESGILDTLDEIKCGRYSVLDKAAYLHGELLTLEPFMYGNEDTALLVLNYYLMLNDYPPIVVEPDRAAQYTYAINHFENTGETALLSDFIRDSIIGIWGTKDNSYTGTICVSDLFEYDNTKGVRV